MVRKVLTAVASMIATSAAAATGYHGPIIDTHAHTVLQTMITSWRIRERGQHRSVR